MKNYDQNQGVEENGTGVGVAGEKSGAVCKAVLNLNKNHQKEIITLIYSLCRKGSESSREPRTCSHQKANHKR